MICQVPIYTTMTLNPASEGRGMHHRFRAPRGDAVGSELGDPMLC